MAPADNPSFDARIGHRLRSARKQAKVSLAELARVTGRSIGYLSQIERGLSSPTLREVALIADVLKVGFMDLVAPHGANAGAEPIRRDADRTYIPFRGPGIAKRVLSPRNSGSIEMFVMEIEADVGTGQQPYSHDGEESGFVLAGSIELTVGPARYRLEPGDSFRFSSRIPHAFRACGTTGAKVLWVNVGHR
ncbi:MAG: XRE family transcriptional regulator [Burkholderiaceae bacterium]